ncbi:Top2mt [Acrasis kona]|uniref:Top2mt n=1 Tax=Acrasis kona TaxID=1008807 RepID=A0AAW2ZP13_9EUKA
MCLYVNCLVQNPTFDSQSKETLTTKIPTTTTINNDVIKQIVASPLYEQILESSTTVKPKKSARTLNIPKLSDANLAGTNKSDECTLILTEGDSAKALAVSGLSILGRERYGVYPLRGKMLNVRDANIDQIEKNAEVSNLRKIIGNGEQLRYGKVMIMCDQDYDGSHIKGLVLNMMHVYYPQLLSNNKIQIFITPIIKATRSNQTHHFYTIPQFQDWSHHNETKNYKIKYYKGLGTSTSQEAKEYFSKLNNHCIQVDVRSGDLDQLNMVFNKKHASLRKQWLSHLKQGTFLDYSHQVITLGDFINKELILFSHHDNVRSIPHLMDGLKPSQRKVLYTCFKKNKNEEIKVAQLSGSVSELTSYHHGEVSLQSTIVNMAQDYIGSNNLPLLVASGQFGTRLQGGKDAASARYIFTKLQPITRFIFHPSDDIILDYQTEENQSIEPIHYVPIIPMILVNGAEGMGTGWSTFIPTFNPLDIIDNILLKMQNKSMKFMNMYVRGFTGEIVHDSENSRFVTRGKIRVKDARHVVIEELPVGKWTEDYKEWLVDQDLKFTEHHSDTTVHFVVKFESEPGDDLIKLFKLESTISMSNMTLFDGDGLVKCDDPLDILSRFYDQRLAFYRSRRNHLIKSLIDEITLLVGKKLFLEHLVGGKENLKQFASLDRQDMIPYLKRIGVQSSDAGGDENDEKGFAHVLNLPIWNLNKMQIEKVTEQLEMRKSEMSELNKSDAMDLWKDDLTKLKSQLIKIFN